MYGLEIYVEGKWILVETKDLKVTDHAYKRAVAYGDIARRVLLVEGGKPIPLDATA